MAKPGYDFQAPWVLQWKGRTATGSVWFFSVRSGPVSVYFRFIEPNLQTLLLWPLFFPFFVEPITPDFHFAISTGVQVTIELAVEVCFLFRSTNPPFSHEERKESDNECVSLRKLMWWAGNKSSKKKKIDPHFWIQFCLKFAFSFFKSCQYKMGSKNHWTTRQKKNYLSLRSKRVEKWSLWLKEGKYTALKINEAHIFG